MVVSAERSLHRRDLYLIASDKRVSICVEHRAGAHEIDVSGSIP